MQNINEGLYILDIMHNSVTFLIILNDVTDDGYWRCSIKDEATFGAAYI